MVEIFPTAQWNSEKFGEINEEWIRPHIFFKTEDPNLYRRYRVDILQSIRSIIQEIEEEGLLESFHFLGQLFPKDLFGKEQLEVFEKKYFRFMLDIRIWIRNGQRIEEAKKIIRKRLNERDDIADFCFWHLEKKHPQYCDNSELYYGIICRIYELFCRFLFEKLDPESSRSILYEKLGQGSSRNLLNRPLDTVDLQRIRNGEFSNWKIIHCFLNSQGMNNIDEANFALFYALERLGNFQMEFRDKYWYFPLQIIVKSVEEEKFVFEVIGEWRSD